MVEASGKKASANANNNSNVIVLPQACCVMALHATRYKYESVHGFLLGTTTNSGGGSSGVTTTTTTVHSAVPVSHGTPPTKPLLEVALGFVEHHENDKQKNDTVGSPSPLSVVGWYTSPSLCQDTQPGPVAIRIASSLSTTSDTSSTILLVLQNEALGSMLHVNNNDAIGQLFQLYKGNGPSSDVVVVQDSAQAGRATREAIAQGVGVEDFVGHLEQDQASGSSSWLQFTEISHLISKC